MLKDKNTIESIASAVTDNGRRGFPRPGCDCVQCFGYCMIDGDAMMRDMGLMREQARDVLPDIKGFTFKEESR